MLLVLVGVPSKRKMEKVFIAKGEKRGARQGGAVAMAVTERMHPLAYLVIKKAQMDIVE